jgi:hypothetical protein
MGRIDETPAIVSAFYRATIDVTATEAGDGAEKQGVEDAF